MENTRYKIICSKCKTEILLEVNKTLDKCPVCLKSLKKENEIHN